MDIHVPGLLITSFQLVMYDEVRKFHCRIIYIDTFQQLYGLKFCAFQRILQMYKSFENYYI